MDGNKRDEHERALNLILDKGVKYYSEIVELTQCGMGFKSAQLSKWKSKEQRALISAIMAARKVGVPGDVIARQRQVAKSIAGYLVLEAANNG